MWYCQCMKNKTYGICYNPNIQRAAYVKEQLYDLLSSNGINADILNIDNLKSGYDFIFVIGGDGTILK